MTYGPLQRLVDQPHEPGSEGAVLSNLLRAYEPPEPDPHRKTRVRARVLAASTRAGGRGLLWRLPIPVTLALVLCVCSGMALAGILLSRVLSRPQPVSKAGGALPSAVTAQPSAVTAQPSAVTAQPSAVTAQPPVLATKRRPRQIQGALAPASNSDPAAESALVLAAMKALRVDHDPARAEVLLEDYLRLHPKGTLAEEALALTLESTLKRGDVSKDAKDKAREYLRRYPRGRFVKVAERVLGGEDDD